MKANHFAILGAIIEFSKPGQKYLEADPLNVEAKSPSEYQWNNDLPFLQNLSFDMQSLLAQKF